MIDIIELLKAKRDEWEHIEQATQAIDDVLRTVSLRLADDYLGELYRTDFVVEGADEFPMDMLRYTCAWPSREEDAHVMHYETKRRVTLSKYHRDPTPHLAEDRWLSKFRWRVIEVIGTVQL